jgi:hypothetical protein
MITGSGATLNFSENGTYSVTVLAIGRENYGNAESEPYQWTIATGIDEIKSDEILIYPNPAVSELTILNCKENSKIEIYDISGRAVTVIQNGKNVINVNSLLQGIYFIKIGEYKGRFIKK